MERDFHEAAKIFPMMSQEELEDLAADIKANGLHNPIELLDKKIIDGRNRYLACGMAHKMPRIVHVKPKDPLAYVLSKNLHRRHLTTSQKAMIAAKVKELYEERAKGRQAEAGKTYGRGKAGKLPANLPEAMASEERQALTVTEGGVEPEERGDARDLAGKALGVSGKTVDAAAKVRAEGDKETIKAVEDGKVSVSAAVKALDKDKEPTAETPKDADGVTIPKALRSIFAVQDRFESFAHRVSRIKGDFESAVEENPEAWSALEPQKRVSELAAMRQEFLEAKPYLVCPVCGGKDPDKRCKQCNGRGWLSRFRARSVAIDLRNPQRVKAGLELLTKSSQKAGEETK